MSTDPEQGARTALRHPLPPGQVLTPRDARFHVILYPHLFHEERQCLETLKIGGVNMLFNDDCYTIRTLRGGVIKAVIRQQVKVMDHIGLGDPLAGFYGNGGQAYLSSSWGDSSGARTVLDVRMANIYPSLP